MSVPHDLQYTEDHEWVQFEGDIARVGVTAYAADALGDVVYLELPEVGSDLTAGVQCGEIESTKSVSDLVAPVSGEVIEVNDAVVDGPHMLNSDPYGDGWLLKIRVRGNLKLLDPEQYAALTGSSS